MTCTKDKTVTGNANNSQIFDKENNTTGKKTVIDKTKFKTEMCKNWIEKQQCNYGDKCKFAHGKQELNEKVIQEKEKYKSKKCQSFYSKGYCLYGVKCLFKHEDRKLCEILNLEGENVKPIIKEQIVQIRKNSTYQHLLHDQNLEQNIPDLNLQNDLNEYIKTKIGDSIRKKLNIFKDIKNKDNGYQSDMNMNCIKKLIF